MEPSLFHYAAIPVARQGVLDHPQQTAEKRRAIEEIFFRHLTQNQELKRRLEIVARDQRQFMQRESELLQQLNAVDGAHINAEMQQQERISELRNALTDSYHQNEALARDNSALREQLRVLELTVSDLRADNAAIRATASVSSVASQRQASASPPIWQTLQHTLPPHMSIVSGVDASRHYHELPKRTETAAVSTPPPAAVPHVLAPSIESFPVIVQTSSPPSNASPDGMPRPAVRSGNDDGGGDVESVSPILRPRRAEGQLFDQSTDAPSNAPSQSPGAEVGLSAPTMSNVVSPVSQEESPPVSRIPSVRVPPPPRVGSGRRLPPTSTPKVPHRAGSLGAIRSPTSMVAQPSSIASAASFVAEANAAPEVSPPIVDATARGPAPLVTSSPGGLRKFNFARVSKLELVGSSSLPAYVTLVERRYTVHLINKASATSKVPTLPPALSREGRCAIPAHPIKMFGQHWYVFQLADHGGDLPSAVSTGSMETLPAQLVYRIQAQQYMKLSDILALFWGVAKALETFHRIGFAHGNVDSCNVFCPRNLSPVAEDQAPPEPGQPMLLSAFAVTPFHRNPLFRAPETKLEPDEATIASDLWALGVVFWDITNYGLAPPYDVSREAATAIMDGVAAFEKVCQGTLKLECPENCPPAVFNELIAPLLVDDPLQRPPIETILATIEGLLQS